MKTRKPLVELIPAILMQYERFEGQLQFDLRLYRMFEGQVRTEVEDSLRQEMVSKAALNRALQRIPSINLPRKIVKKVSKIYTEKPTRQMETASDDKLLSKYSKIMNVDEAFATANEVYNLHNRAAIEFYLEDGKQSVRVLGGHQFFVLSDSPFVPNKPSVFIKLLGQGLSRPRSLVNEDGERNNIDDDVRKVQLMAVYSEDEFMIIDSCGDLREDVMLNMGLTSTKNPFGTIPFVYYNRSPFEIMPYPNRTMLDMGILIPKLLTDLNYAAQFLSHSVIYSVNADLEGAEINPDALLDLGSSGPNGEIPQIGTIDPRTDIDGVLKLIGSQLGYYLSTLGIKSNGVGKVQGDSQASGVSKVIDESDATAAVKEQKPKFANCEREFWYKFSLIQSYWSRTGAVLDKETFSPKAHETFSVYFPEVKPLESDKTRFEKIKLGRDIKLLTKKQALVELYPEETEVQIDRRIQELEEEGKKEKAEMLQMGLTPGFMQLQSQQQNKPIDEVKNDVQGPGEKTGSSSEESGDKS